MKIEKEKKKRNSFYVLKLCTHAPLFSALFNASSSALVHRIFEMLWFALVWCDVYDLLS